jgi:hypothetical protein
MSIKTLFIVFGLLVSSFLLTGQKYYNEEIYNLGNDNIYIDEILNQLVTKHNVSLTYSPSQFANTKLPLSFDPKGNISSIIKSALKYFNYNLLNIDNKLLLQVAGERKVAVSGYVLDGFSREPIINAIIIDTIQNTYTFSNDQGFFSINTDSDYKSFHFRALGYKKKIIQSVDIEKNRGLVLLAFDNNLAPVLISESANENFIIEKFAQKIMPERLQNNTTVFGEKDIINAVKINPGVSSGGEGQSGLYVRGASPDNNLILLEGIPLYETNHVVGLSSIFMDQSVRSIQFMKSGFPARYAGRLSSVVDVQLKDGNQEKTEGSISAGLHGITFELDGPLNTKNLSYNLSFRKSWVDFLIDQVANKVNTDNEVDVNYYDLLAKMSWKINPYSKLSFTFYNGTDRLDTYKVNEIVSEDGSSFNSFNDNGLKWGTTLASLNYSTLLGDKTHLNTTLGVINYNAQTYGRFGIDTSLNVETFTKTDIMDIPLKIHLDRYLNDDLRLSFGLNYINHHFNPSIFQYVNEPGTPTNNDDFIKTTESGLYTEFRYSLSQKVIINGGLHLANYSVEDTSFVNIQPRASIQYVPHKNHLLSISTSKMNQNVHLLVNPGLGLPSDLWIPSTKEISPQEAIQLSFLYHYTNPSGWNFNLEAYVKRLNNIPDFTKDIDFFSKFINEEPIVPDYIGAESWQDGIVTGKGKSKGIEISLNKDKGRLKGFAAVSFSKTTRTYKDINNGQAYSFKYDRPIDINIGVNYGSSESFSYGLQWKYVSGSTFSLPGDEFNSIWDITLLNPDGKNNYRLPAFHELSVNGNYKFDFLNNEASLNFGIYNVYNRLNAYYVYFYRDNTNANNIISRKVSIFPIIPFVNIKFNLK